MVWGKCIQYECFFTGRTVYGNKSKAKGIYNSEIKKKIAIYMVVAHSKTRRFCDSVGDHNS